MSMHDFNIQTIGIELSYSFSYVHMENAECAFMLTLSYILSYSSLNVPVYYSIVVSYEKI